LVSATAVNLLLSRGKHCNLVANISKKVVVQPKYTETVSYVETLGLGKVDFGKLWSNRHKITTPRPKKGFGIAVRFRSLLFSLLALSQAVGRHLEKYGVWSLE
jgi:hypothetical protein